MRVFLFLLILFSAHKSFSCEKVGNSYTYEVEKTSDGSTLIIYKYIGKTEKCFEKNKPLHKEVIKGNGSFLFFKDYVLTYTNPAKGSEGWFQVFNLVRKKHEFGQKHLWLREAKGSVTFAHKHPTAFINGPNKGCEERMRSVFIKKVVQNRLRPAEIKDECDCPYILNDSPTAKAAPVAVYELSLETLKTKMLPRMLCTYSR